MSTSAQSLDSSVASTRRDSVTGGEVETLMPLPLSRAGAMEKFFVQYAERPVNDFAADEENFEGHRRDGKENVPEQQPRNEDDMLLEQFAQYTDDDSFYSSSSTVLESNPNRMQNKALRGRAVNSVHDTLQLRALTGGRVPEEREAERLVEEKWYRQVHIRDIALHHTSFFMFPARWTPRVVVYNFMHHWVMEMVILFLIVTYSIFQACWARYPAPRGELKRPDFMLWADVFYTILLGFEVLLRLFASGFILHKRAYMRSPWNWLDVAVLVLMIIECTWWKQMWNFTAWRLLRTIKCFTHVPIPSRMKILAKSLLRSTNRVIQTTIVLIYFIFFFALLGLHLFVSELHSRCVDNITGVPTAQLCRPSANGKQWFYWGHVCASGYTCVMDKFPNPHYDFRSFDDIGHSMLSVFQIMTFQGWDSLMLETNDGLTVMAFLYYAFTILVCTWIVPSLFLGVFMEKIEKTARLFILKQLDRFDNILIEQRQRQNLGVRLLDYVEKDEGGHVTSYPVYGRKMSTDEDISSDSQEENVKRNKKLHKSVHDTKWTNEQRVQLHLSLTRQRSISDEAERKRHELANEAHEREEQSILNAARRGSLSRHNSSVRSAGSSTQGKVTRIVDEPNFALGGRVGETQHHENIHSIGASKNSELPFAVRQEFASENIQFLEHYNSTPVVRDESVSTYRPPLMTGAATNSANGSFSAQGPTKSMSVLRGRETAGVVPNQRGVAGPMDDSALTGAASAAGAPASAEEEEGQLQLVINDPEGGDFSNAASCWERVNIIRNIVHMFTEGFPRILSLYLWENRMMQYRYGLTPLTFVNRYEEDALKKLRQRRLRERAEERSELRRHGVYHMTEEEEVEDAYYQNMKTTEQATWGGEEGDYKGDVMPWMVNEGLVLGSISPIRMARNIRENAPLTVFNYIMLFLFVANAVFNASRFDTMPDYWEMGTFVAGVCFSALFMLELLLRLFAMGPGPFFVDLFNLIEFTFMVISLFQLGFSRSNTTSLFNWVRFLRMLRVMPIRPMRRVSRVLIHAFPDMVYAIIFFSMYMFMWLLLGMSFFGTRVNWINYAGDDYGTRGSFTSFSYAAYAVAQAFSVNRDQWQYLSWNGMRMRGGYTIMYFICTVFVAFVFRYFMIAVFAHAWQTQEESDDYDFMSGSSTHNKEGRNRLWWFDFTVWRSFKHIHGGFDRRDVAPDEVYYLNEDMKRQLRLAEAKERYIQQQYGESPSRIESETPEGPQYVVIGGQLMRQRTMPAEMRRGQSDSPRRPLNYGEREYYNNKAENAQLRFARQQYRAVPATTYDTNPDGEDEDEQQQQNSNNDDRIPGVVPLSSQQLQQHEQRQQQQQLRPPPTEQSRTYSEASHSIINPLVANRHSLSPARGPSVYSGLRAGGTQHSLRSYAAPSEGLTNTPTILAKLHTLRRDETANADNAAAPVAFEHLLLPGPRYRYKSVFAFPWGTAPQRVFECCLDCNTHKQMPLRAAPGVAQRNADELHEEHCHMAAVRSSRQLVLDALMGFARLQADMEARPTQRVVETVLGQAWACGMLLFDTIEYTACLDLPEEERTWDRMLEALETQQWILSLHVGEEQVGRAALAYILAHQKKQEEMVEGTAEKTSWTQRSYLALPVNNPVRRFCTTIVESIWFEIVSLIIIYGASICLSCYYPESGNRDFGDTYNKGKYKALHVLDDIFAILFTIEMVLKWISMGIIFPLGKGYFCHLWNIFDCFIVIISLVSWGHTNTFLRYLKVMRCFRILGPLRSFRWSKSMMYVARTIWDSIPTLANICLIMLMNYIVWAILFVSMFMNKMNYCSNSVYTTKSSCVENGFQWMYKQRNFRNFYESLFTTFEISTGAEWMDVMYQAVDSWSTTQAMRPNRHPYLGLVFIAYYYVSHFVLFTLFASAVIYCYLLTKSAAEGAAGLTWEHRLWLKMQRSVMDLQPRARLVPLNNDFSRFLHKLVTHVAFECFMALIIVFNMLIIALEWYHMSSTQELVLNIFQWIFVAIFTIEVLLRLGAHGLRFFSRWAFCFDLFMVALSYVQIGCNTTARTHVPFNVNVLRVLRVGRVLTLVNICVPFETHLSLLVRVVKRSVPGVISVTLIYMIAVYVFGVLGLHFLGYVVPFGGYIDDTYNNFRTWVNALIMVFRLSTMENWVAMMRGSMSRGSAYCINGRPSGRCGPTNWAPVYYIPMVFCFYLLLSTLYMAVVLENYLTSTRLWSSMLRLKDLRRFVKLWTQHDPNSTLLIPASELLEILEDLRLPLGISSRHNRCELLNLLREYNIPIRNDERVYYYDVLLPLARRVMAMAFHEGGGEKSSGSLLPFESAWRLSEWSLSALPVIQTAYSSDGDERQFTTAEYFAATYVQAAYRRDKARQQYFVRLSNEWKRGRETCDAAGLPYDTYGFGRIGLAYEDPALEAERRGYCMDGTGRVYAGPEQRQRQDEAADTAPCTRLPSVYRPIISEGLSTSGRATPRAYSRPHEGVRRFGPDVPGAIKRHERRDEKLARQREAAERRANSINNSNSRRYLPTGDEEEESPVDEAVFASEGPARFEQPPLGTDLSTLRDEEMRRYTSGRNNH